MNLLRGRYDDADLLSPSYPSASCDLGIATTEWTLSYSQLARAAWRLTGSFREDLLFVKAVKQSISSSSFETTFIMLGPGCRVVDLHGLVPPTVRGRTAQAFVIWADAGMS